MPTFNVERVLWSQGVSPIAGIDEAGRGPLAGPVIASAVMFLEEQAVEQHPLFSKLNDSKKLRPRLREELFEILTNHPTIIWAVGEASVEEIGTLNILHATHLAMKRALEGLSIRPAHVLIDGLAVKNFPVIQTALVKGDSLSLSIAAASVIAKVTRDRIMDQLDLEFPHYGFARHRGYGTAAHLAQLRHYGPCYHHRRGFAPVDQATFSF